MKWRVITSTISFGKYVEIVSETVFADTEERAEQAARDLGLDRMLGFKYQRVEPIPA